MRVCVTGGAGVVGSALCRRLSKDGHEVVAFDNLARGRAERLPQGVTWVLGDIRNEEDVINAVTGCDFCIHAAYVQGTQVFTEQPKLTIDVALTGIMNVLRACEEQVGLLLLSSSEAYQVPPEGMTPTPEIVPLSVPDPRNPRYAYGGGKIASEIAAMAYADSLPAVIIVRPHNIYGPDAGYEHVIPQLACRMLETPVAGGPWTFRIQGTGAESRCFNYIDDAVDGIMTALEHGAHREIYHVGMQEECSIRQLAEKIAVHYGREIEVTPSALPKGSPPRRVPDVSKLRAIGYEPKWDLDAGLVPTLDWYAANFDERPSHVRTLVNVR